MNDALIIIYDPFAMESRVTVYKDNRSFYTTVASDIHELAEKIVPLAYEKDVYNLRISAPFEIVQEMRDTIKTIENGKFSENKLVIEGI